MGYKRALLALGLLLPAAVLPAAERRMPEITGITAWFNSPPLSRKELAGKVVLVDFWTHRCGNCIRTLPHVLRWHETYRDDGFVVVGIHTPETEGEGKEENVRGALRQYKITYPVALDNDYKTWRAFGNRYWPAHYLVDKKGRIRHFHAGEGAYEEMEAMIRRLLAEP